MKGTSKQFRALSPDFEDSRLIRHAANKHGEGTADFMRVWCVATHLISTGGRLGIQCGHSLAVLRHLFGPKSEGVLDELQDFGFLKHDKQLKWVWVKSAALWQNAPFLGDCSWWAVVPGPDGERLKGPAAALATWKLIYSDVLSGDFPFKREFIAEHYRTMRLDLAGELVPGFKASVERGA
ncbi:hypothetical protein EBT16_15050 [bacterium]|nr:hypothetical protein [bacterium]